MLLASLIFCIILAALRSLFRGALRLGHIRGPKSAAYTRFWMMKVLASGDSAAKYVQVNKQYGSLARIGPNHLLTSDPVTTQKILAVRSKYTRGPWYDSLRIDPHRTNLVTERDTRKHSTLRHQLSPGYGGKDVEGVEAAIDTRLDEWLLQIERKWISSPGETKRLDIGRSIQFLTTDVISHLSFGEPLGFVKNERDMFAGSDTTATALRATLLNIITNPSIYAKLQSEIDFIAATEDGLDIVKSYVANQKMPYLQACIKEGLRVFPPITALRERVTPPEGDIIDGHHIPGGVNVGLNMRGVLLNEAFGSDADVFRPERWLEADTKQLNEMKNIHELVFGHGFTRCLGINIAKMNLNKVLFEVGAKFLWRANMILPTRLRMWN
ncbi:MAG: hypothetical protein Q9172_003933 [Xanthocarpia lactea]